MDKTRLRHVSPPILQFSRVSIFPQVLHTHLYQKEKRARVEILKQSNSLSDVGEHLTAKCFHTVCHPSEDSCGNRFLSVYVCV